MEVYNPNCSPVGPMTYKHIRKIKLMVHKYKAQRYREDFKEAYRVAVVLYYGYAKVRLGVIAAQVHKYKSAAVIKGIERFVAERNYIDSVRGEGTLAKFYLNTHKEYYK